MLITTFYKPPPVVLDKLHHLLQVLQKARKNFEDLASSVRNKEIRQTILGFVQESKQYSSELVSHIAMLGGEPEQKYEPVSSRYDALPEKDHWEIVKEEKDGIKYCTMMEKSILETYRNVLNEPFLYEDLRKMIRYQLNGMMHSFAQLKLLHASLSRKRNPA